MVQTLFEFSDPTWPCECTIVAFVLQAVIDSVGDLTSYQLSVAVCQLFGITGSHPAHSALVRTIKSHAMADAERHPVIIILDKVTFFFRFFLSLLFFVPGTQDTLNLEG